MIGTAQAWAAGLVLLALVLLAKSWLPSGLESRRQMFGAY